MTTAAAVDPERLLKELRALWRDLGKQDPNGVLRACAMTLIVVLEEKHDAGPITETIAQLMHEHPSRLIMIRVRRCSEQLLEARVFAQCWMPFGRQQQICCEQVEIIASESGLADVPSVIRGLIVPDLPSIIFCPSEELWWLPQFRSLLPLTTKLIVDSCGMHDSARVLDFWREVVSDPDQRADLVWSRLTPWRQAVARLFEDRTRSEQVSRLRSVRIGYTGKEKPSGTYYMAAWFRHVLRAKVSIDITPQQGLEYADIAAIELRGEGFDALITVTDRNTAETRINGNVEEVTALPIANDQYALRQELSVGIRDPLFEAVLSRARQIRENR